MKTLEILKARKEEIVKKTLELLPTALSGDKANRTFFFIVDDKGKLTVDYHYYAGQIALDDNCFYTLKDHETPAPEDFGYDSLEEIDFEACGFKEHIESVIDQHILTLEA